MSNREKMCIIMDMNGYEQDGKGLDFINLHGKGNKHFNSEEELYSFIVENFLPNR